MKNLYEVKIGGQWVYVVASSFDAAASAATMHTWHGQGSDPVTPPVTEIQLRTDNVIEGD